MQLHPDVGALRFLIGTWRGTGTGVYPTIASFEYTEEVIFIPGPNKPFLAYTQRTWRAGSDEALHTETGYLRGFGSERLELVIAQPTGIVEAHTGVLAGTRLAFAGVAVATPAAKQVSATEREIIVTGDRLDYRLAMEAVGQPPQHHLAATLTRVDG
jgi:hypothetical protein